MCANPAYVKELLASAEAGTFVLTPEAARECAAHFNWYGDRMHAFQEQVSAQSRLSGFGGFESAIELQAGFEAKAIQGFEAFVRAEHAARLMAAAALRAAGLLEEVDAANAAAQKALEGKIND